MPLVCGGGGGGGEGRKSSGQSKQPGMWESAWSQMWDPDPRQAFGVILLDSLYHMF